MDMFMSNLKQESLANHNVAFTENDARVYGSTGHALLDLNFSVAVMRNMSDEQIIEKFMAAFQEDKILATKWLFYARDVRMGLGERRLFRVIMNYMVRDPMAWRHLIPLIPMYGRWDDILEFLGTPMEQEALRVIANQLHEDQVRVKNKQPISLLAKWLPSVNTTSATSRRQAIIIQRYLGISIPAYRKLLSKLRNETDVVERKMSANDWGLINYSRVPSRANLLYAAAFLKHDPERRRAFLDAVLKGEKALNAGVIYPHEIVSKITGSSHFNDMDQSSVEALWASLPAPPNPGRTMVIMDGSASMKCCPYKKSSVRCLDVSMALAIYFSQYLKGPFTNRFITFSATPRIVDLSAYDGIYEKVLTCQRYNECTNTNIEAVFELILQSAINNQMPQEDLPERLLIISDMEFDRAVDSNTDRAGYLNPNLFEHIAERWAQYGYKIPRVCFWNVYGKSGGIPMIQNDLGVSLVSGFSVNNIKLIMSEKVDAYEALVEVLSGPRYEAIMPSLVD